MPKKSLTEADLPSLLFEIGQLFTPSTPIRLADLFAGRRGQIRQLSDAVAEPGRHALIYGERGVGKTSLSQILEYVVPAGRQRVVHMRKACTPDDTYESIWRKFFKDMRFSLSGLNGATSEHSVAELYPTEITPDDVLREMKQFSANDVPIFVIDEFNEVRDSRTSSLMANTIKTLSDEGVGATVVVVGVADSVTQLFEEHQSISRCCEEVQMPRMSQEELGQIIDQRLSQLGMTIEPDARWKIVILSRGLPTYVHRLGKHACSRAAQHLRFLVTEADVDSSIEEILLGSLQSLRDRYQSATASNQPGNLFKEILLACALSKADDAGYFMPAQVREPLELILGRTMTIAQYQNHLNDWHGLKRGQIFQRIGEPRAYRFRFAEPTMQPYVLMRGIADGMVTDGAKEILRFPAQGQLFQE